MSGFNKKYQACKEIRKYSLYTGKKETNWNLLWGSPDTALTEQKTLYQYLKYVQKVMETLKTMPHQMENINRNYKKKPSRNFGVKSTITEMKNSLEGLLQISAGRVGKLQDKSTKIYLA